VIGDVETGSYVTDGIAEFFRDRALALADIVTPNRFELEYLTGAPVATLAEATSAAEALRARGPSIVLVTSIDAASAQSNRVSMLAAGPDGAWAVETPRLPVVLNGCGDVTAALFLAHLLRGATLSDALALTAAAIFAVIETTLRLDRYELALVAAQDELLSPTRRFAPQPL
jgi:pyridoxine kinase